MMIEMGKSTSLVLIIAAATLLLAFLSQPVLAQTSITTCTELQNIRNNLGGDYYLANDIDCSGFDYGDGKGFMPIGNLSSKFTGTFDGKGYKITHLYINRPSTVRVGLFGCTGSGSEIKDVSLGEVDVSGSRRVGGLVGGNSGAITNSSSSGSVRGSSYYVGGLVGGNSGAITNSSSSGSVSGSSSVGGLVGFNYGPITNSYSSGSVTGSSYVGGLVGYNSGGTITNCYSFGSVSGSDDVGGLVGKIYGGTITNCYWDTQTSGQSSSAGGTGKTTAQMKQQATFSGWDFDTVWGIEETVTYPYLQWLIIITSFAPESPVNDTVCTWRTFNVTVNQPVNVSWYLNNSLLHTNQSVTEANYTLHAEFVGDNNVSAVAENANGTDMQEWVWNVTGPTLELGSVTDITEDWGMNLNLNHSVTVTNANASNVNVSYNVSWLTTQSLGTVNKSETKWANQTVSNSTVQNITVEVNANSTNVSAINDTKTFWINITRRDIGIVANPEATQTVDPDEIFWINASAKDEYDDALIGKADLLREGSISETKDITNGNANFSRTEPSAGIFNFSIRFYNLTHYNNATTSNSSVTVTGPTLELGSVIGITEDWGMNFNLNHSVTVTNANASNVNVSYNVSWLTTQSLGTVNKSETKWANQTVSNSTVQNVTVRANANTTNASAVNDTETFWINITRRDIGIVANPEATQTVDPDTTFWINGSAKDEYDDELTGKADLLREGSISETKDITNGNANFSRTEPSAGTFNFSIRFYNLTHYNNETTSNSSVTVTGPTLELGSVTSITEDWGMNFNLNHSVTVTNANASNVNVSYNISWIPVYPIGTVNRSETEWANQTVSNSTVQNVTVRVNANSTNVSAVNDTETFWINITRRDITATVLSPATQTVNVSETFSVNASAVDEYGEDFIGDADLLRDGTEVVDTQTGIAKYANFTTNVSTSGAYNFSVLFFNTSYYNNDTSDNTTVTVSGAVLEIGNVSDITKDWGRDFCVNHSVTARNATANNVTLNHSYWLTNKIWDSIAKGSTEWWNQSVSNNSVANNSILVQANATDANNASATFWINITKRDIGIVANPEATQTVDPDEIFWINASAKDEYGDELTGKADLLREGSISETKDITNGNANFSRTEPSAGTFNFSIRFYNLTHYNNETTSNSSVTVSRTPPAPLGGGSGRSLVLSARDTSVRIEPTGRVTATLIAPSADKKAVATIPAGTIAKDAVGKPLTQIVVVPSRTLPAAVPSGTEYGGYAYDFGPTGATFDPPVEISITFDSADCGCQKPVIYVYEEGWNRLATTVVESTATAKVNHFSTHILCCDLELEEAPAPTLMPSPTPSPVLTPTPTPLPAPAPMVPKFLFLVLIIIAVIVIAGIIVIVLKRKIGKSKE